MHLIHKKCFTHSWSEAEFTSLLNSDGAFVIKEEGKGFILCRTIIDETEILTICVAPEFQKQGIANRLLNEAFIKAKGTNFFLEVNENNEAAKTLYQKNGFKVVGRRKKYYNNKDDALIMRKDNV